MTPAQGQPAPQPVDALAGRSPGLVLLPAAVSRGSGCTSTASNGSSAGPGRRRWVEMTFLVLRLGGLGRSGLRRAAAREGRGLPGRAARGLRLLHGFLIRPQPHRDATGLAEAEVGLSAPAGADEPQHQRRTADVDLHGRAELSGRAPLVPLHGSTPPAEDPAAGGGLLRCRRRPLHPDQPVAGVPVVIDYLNTVGLKARTRSSVPSSPNAAPSRPDPSTPLKIGANRVLD